MDYGFSAYKKTSINTATNEEILLMLYRTAINHTKKAIVAIEEYDIKAKAKHIDKVQAIAIELNEGLNFNVGKGEEANIAYDLSSLYDYIIRACTEASIQLDPKPLHSVYEVLLTLYDGWSEAVKKVKNNEANA
jgi:flagellar protein FliS